MTSETVLKANLDKYFQRIQRIYNYAEKGVTAEDAQEFVSRCAKIEEYQVSYEDYAERILAYELETKECTPEKEKLLQSQYVERCKSFDDMYSTIVILLDKCKNSISKTNKDQTVVMQQSASVKLPQIQLKTFDGEMKNWSSFFENFKALIHENKTLTTVEKFHYLVSSLKGPALSLTSHLPITSENYDIVWKNLVFRYENKRTLGANLLDAILEQPMLTNNSANALSNLVSVINDSVESLKALKLPQLEDFILLHIGLKKLPVNLRKTFESQNIKSDVPKLDNFIEFLRQQVKITELSGTTKKEEFPNSKNSFSRKVYISSEKSNEKKNCSICQNNHIIYFCPEFKGLTVEERRNKVQQLHLCYNCLHPSHGVKECTSKYSCRVCNQKHNSLLHSEKTKIVAALTQQNNEETAEVKAYPVSSTAIQEQVSVVLGTAIIHVEGSDGVFRPARAVLDSASMQTFITEECAKRLNLNTRRKITAFSGITEDDGTSKHVVTCCIKPKFTPKNKLRTEAAVVPKITNSLPLIKVSSEVAKKWAHLQLADPNFADPAPVDILTSAEIFPYLFTGKKIFGEENSGCAMESIFGWVISGRIKTQVEINSNISFMALNNFELEKAITRLWQVEEPPAREIIDPEDKICEQMFQDLHYREADGRYVVPLMLKMENPVFSGTFSLAQNHLRCMERRLQKSSQLKTDYSEFIKEYEDLGHMVKSNTIGEASYYIPHHCVIREASLSTKLRVVFDASRTAPNGVSLNSVLYPGPKLQKDIVEIIARFRTYPVALTTDICKMFRQILIRPEERKYQHILWKESADAPVQDFQLKTVTYGTVSAPYLANRTILQLAKDEGETCPKAAKVLERDIYVDDLLTGENSIEEALELKRQLIALLGKGKFELKKWASSHTEVLKDLKEDEVALKLDLDKGAENSLAVLGIKWIPADDCFTYNQIEFSREVTKRAVLSNIAKIYDPLGWITPAVLTTKSLIQELWLLGLDWDDPMPADISERWLKFLDQLPLLTKLRIPRFIFNNHQRKITLIGFSDASLKGYGAAVYVRVHEKADKFQSNLFLAKSKVAPTKPLTVPRLELCGAEVLAKLLRFAVRTLISSQVEIEQIIAISDSTTALSWISTPAHQLKEYVRNRVANITEDIPNAAWAHARTDQNPADLLSRGLNPAQLVNNNFWWHGPHWLCQASNSWSIVPIHRISNLNDAEVRREVKEEVSLHTVEKKPEKKVIDGFSSLTQLQKLTAQVVRYVRLKFNLKQETVVRNSLLTTEELDEALKVWIKIVQKEVFALDLKNLKNKEPVSAKLRPLTPFIDREGILRVRGRLENADLPYDAKYPMILPGNHKLSELIVREYHQENLHAGPRLLQSILSQKFWLLPFRQTLRYQLKQCVRCFRCDPQSSNPLMGNLPESRVKPSRCFLRVGVDYGGPFFIRDSKRRNSSHHKAYICLFVCMATKAVHLELVSALSTEAFIAALDRFVARRGLCQEIFSDNGTNFVGAKNHFNELQAHLVENSEKLTVDLRKRKIKWNFNPPSAPHFGGIWEAGIKSVKYHLLRVVGEQKLLFEEFQTVLAKIEAILNSRPLCDLSADPEDIDVLTPAHFLIGGPLLSLPEYDLTQEPVNRLSRWQLTQQVSQHFWERWSKEYLNTLMQRNKWNKMGKPIKLGDICVIKDDNLPALQWRMGRVVKLHPGNDNVIRVVTLKLKSGTLIRPVSKVCVLPLPDANEEN